MSNVRADISNSIKEGNEDLELYVANIEIACPSLSLMFGRINYFDWSFSTSIYDCINEVK